MPKDLYFIDSIFFHQGDNTASIRLLSTEPQEESARIVTLSSQRLALRGFFGPIKEGYYVYYHENENLPFTYGNRSPFAKRMFQKYYAFLETLSKNFIVPDNSNDDQLINLLQKSDRLHVLSYHVNVGHGNCSFILILVGGEYRLWAVDCSIKDSKGTYRGNLNACLDEIACCAGVKDWHRLHISRFFLTHLHDDHFNGMEDLIDNGIIDANTICYINWYYQMASPVFISIMNKLSKLGVRSIEPIIQNSMPCIGILYPECRIYRHPITVSSSSVPQHRIEKCANNASSVLLFELGERSMMFPGDLQLKGFKSITCKGEMYSVNYYAVSHHGSDNGHPDFAPLCRVPGVSYVNCLRTGISKAVLMGRDGAYPGIYSRNVLSFWRNKANCLVLTESDSSGNPNKFVKLDWGNGTVRNYQ